MSSTLVFESTVSQLIIDLIIISSKHRNVKTRQMAEKENDNDWGNRGAARSKSKQSINEE